MKQKISETENAHTIKSDMEFYTSIAQGRFVSDCARIFFHLYLPKHLIDKLAYIYIALEYPSMHVIA